MKCGQLGHCQPHEPSGRVLEGETKRNGRESPTENNHLKRLRMSNRPTNWAGAYCESGSRKRRMATGRIPTTAVKTSAHNGYQRKLGPWLNDRVQIQRTHPPAQRHKSGPLITRGETHRPPRLLVINERMCGEKKRKKRRKEKKKFSSKRGPTTTPRERKLIDKTSLGASRVGDGQVEGHRNGGRHREESGGLHANATTISETIKQRAKGSTSLCTPSVTSQVAVGRRSEHCGRIRRAARGTRGRSTLTVASV